MQINVLHTTRYDYETAVPYGLQQVRLKPRSDAGQVVQSWDLSVEGGVVDADYLDNHGNSVCLITLAPGAKSIEIVCRGKVETLATSGVVGFDESYTPLWYFSKETELTRAGPNVRALVADLPENEDLIARLHGLTRLVLDKVPYRTGQTAATTNAEDAIQSGQGVCQDHAHIFISAARLLGLQARYVSGYLMMDGRVDQDASHAWAEVFVADIGWVGFDVSNAISPDERYIRIATGADYNEAAPVSGIVYGGGGESLVVSLQVQQ